MCIRDTPCSVDTFNPPHCLPSVVLCDLRGLCVKGRAWESVAVGAWLRLRRSGFSVVLISLPMNCQSGSWVHGAKKFGDVFVGSFVEAGIDKLAFLMGEHGSRVETDRH